MIAYYGLRVHDETYVSSACGCWVDVLMGAADNLRDVGVVIGWDV